jgi:Zn-dependent protease with chaperone function
MIGKNEAKGTLLDKIRELSWWTFYSLFLLTVLYLLFLLLWALIGGAFEGISSFGQFIYLGGLVIAVFGLLGLCIGYIVKVMLMRLRSKGGEQIHTVTNRWNREFAN